MLVSFGWACAMDSLPALVVAVVFTVFLDLKSRREEAWLRQQYPATSCMPRRLGASCPTSTEAASRNW